MKSDKMKRKKKTQQGLYARRNNHLIDNDSTNPPNASVASKTCNGTCTKSINFHVIFMGVTPKFPPGNQSIPRTIDKGWVVRMPATVSYSSWTSSAI
jgi:hypothetical protein